MRLGLIGLGRMGRAVEELARFQGQEVVWTRELGTEWGELSSCEVLIDFSVGSMAWQHLELAVHHGVDLVLGTTGWAVDRARIESLVGNRIGVLYSSNFSIGMNLLFEVARETLQRLAGLSGFDVAIFEQHHRGKQDAPSGTAKTLAGLVLQHYPQKTKIFSALGERAPAPDELVISALRVGATFGQHVVAIDGESDSLTLTHTAKSRIGFAQGALLGASWLPGRKGVFHFPEVFGDICRSQGGPS